MLQLKLESKLKSKIDWEAIAHTDEMTQLPNRRALDRHLAALAELKKQVSIAIIDFDFFKKINDTQGHLAGDEALKSVARSLLDTVRDLDNETAIACRFGGDEFVFVADIDPLLVGILCLSAVQQAGFKASIGISFGIASRQLFQVADKAVFQAKSEGRDRFVIA